jgi:hypothetical protein
MSCATHRLDGGIATEVKIYDHNGQLLDTLKNEE